MIADNDYKLRHFARQLNWNAPVEDWTPPNPIGDRWVFWACVVIAVLVLL